MLFYHKFYGYLLFLLIIFFANRSPCTFMKKKNKSKIRIICTILIWFKFFVLKNSSLITITRMYRLSLPIYIFLYFFKNKLLDRKNSRCECHILFEFRIIKCIPFLHTNAVFFITCKVFVNIFDGLHIFYFPDLFWNNRLVTGKQVKKSL